MRNVIYAGTNPDLKGKTAIALPSKRPGMIRVQIDDVRHKHSHGWHEYPATDWKDDESC